MKDTGRCGNDFDVYAYADPCRFARRRRGDDLLRLQDTSARVPAEDVHDAAGLLVAIHGAPRRVHAQVPRPAAGRDAHLAVPAQQPARPCAASAVTEARKVLLLGWPKICKLAHAFLWKHSYKKKAAVGPTFGPI